LECEAPASLLISQKTGKLRRSNAKRCRVAAVQSQAEAPDIKTIKTRDKFLTKSFLPTSQNSVGEFSVGCMIKLIFSFSVLLFLSGCATYIVRFDTEKEKRAELSFIYPATKIDCDFIAMPFIPLHHKFDGPCAAEEEGACYGFGIMFLFYGVIDIPFSILSDTFMFPYDLYNRNPKESQRIDVSNPSPPDR
jgi:uncharacterized protein YceK